MKPLLISLSLTLVLLLGCARDSLYVRGQFRETEQTNFIKLNYPEPEDYNPKSDDPLMRGQCSGNWIKRCEWWCEQDINGR